MADTPTVLAPEHSDFWAAWNAAMEPPLPPPHRCDDWCRPYTGPVIQGRRDPVTLRPLEEVS